MLFELLGFLLSTNAKVKKMTTVLAVMFEIVEMYLFQIHLHYFFTVLYVKAKPWFILFLNLFQNLYTSHFFWKDFSCFRRLILSLSWKSNDRGGVKFWTYLHATVLLAVKYAAELNKYILIVRVICEKYRFRGQSNVPLGGEGHLTDLDVPRGGEGHLTVLETGIFRK